MNIPSMNPLSMGHSVDRTGPAGPDGRRLPGGEDAVKELSQEFETILVSQILKQANKTTMGEASSGPAAMYRDLATEQLSTAISNSGGLGFAEAFEQQLMQQTLATQNNEND